MRRSFAILAAIMLLNSTVAGLCAADEVRPPNIVMIVSDDQTYSDFGFMGNDDVLTPHLDQLASQSARYINGYVPSSVCRPSLVTMLTGLYPHQHGISFNHPPPGFAKLTKSPDIDKQTFDELRQRAAIKTRDLPTIPRLLAANGYRCLQTGKYWEGHWSNAGFTEGMTIAEPSGGKYGDKQLANGDIVAHGNGDHGLAIGRETMQPIADFLDDCGERPFFVWYAPFLPHTPHDSPQEYYDRYANKPDIPEHRRPYYASIAQFDDTVGQLVEMLDRRGVSEKTLFVFVVDNGWTPDRDRYVSARSEWDHTKRSKRAPFEDGLRTPILLRWDGHIEPHTMTELVSSIDLFPTILRATGIDAPKAELPGIDLLPSARGDEELSKDRPIFGAIYPGDATRLVDPAGHVAYRWMRQGRYKLIVPHSHRGQPPWNGYLSAPALFDVTNDPVEQADLLKAGEHQKEAEHLRQLLDDWWNPDES